MTRGPFDARRLPGLAFVLILSTSLGLGGCSTLRIHRPEDLARAQQAQRQFQAANLTQAVASERQRLDQVLAEELDLVRKHTLARRNARLLYVIKEGDTREAWDFLAEDLEKRLKYFGITNTSQLEDRLGRDAEAKRQLEVLNQSAANYKVERQSDPSLPALACPQAEGVTPPPSDSTAILFWEDYSRECQQYLQILQGRRVQASGHGTPRRPLNEPLVNSKAIEAMKAAKEAAQQATAMAEHALSQAREDYARDVAQSGSTADRQPVREAAKALIHRAEKVKVALEAFVQGENPTALDDLGLDTVAAKLEKARNELSELGLNLSSVVGDLGSVPLVAKLETSRSEVVAALSSILEGETTSKVFGSLEAIDAAFTDSTQAPLTAMVLKEKQLALDIKAARSRESVYDETLALLEQQEAAYRDELAYLGQAELRRQELIRKGCLSGVTIEDSELIDKLFTDQDPAVVKCREIVFRLLVQYSAAWTFGRVESEQVDYRLIALHHESALDTSEIAFQKWASLLGPPIDQLVALSETGIQPADIANPIVNAFGLGAIAAGVN